MQLIIIAVLIVIAGLIGALLACATSLINRARAANTTLRRIEETLLSINRVKAIDSAIKSATPVTQPQSADAGSAGFLTLRELKKMSAEGRSRADSAPIPNGRKSPKTNAPPRSTADLQDAIGPTGTLAVHIAEVAAHGADSGQASAAFAKRDPSFEASEVTPTEEILEASENPSWLDSSFEISWPRPNQPMPSMDLQKGADDAIVRVSHMTVTSVAQKVPTVNDDLPAKKAGAEVEQAPVAISPAIREMSPEVSPANSDRLREPNDAPTVESAAGRDVPEASNALDEGRRRKREQEALMIISSRRRRARAGR